MTRWQLFSLWLVHYIFVTTESTGNNCLKILRAWNFSQTNLTTTVELPYLPMPTSLTDTRLRGYFVFANWTATQCTSGRNLPSRGRIVDAHTFLIEPGRESKWGPYSEVLNAIACVPARECTDENDIAAAMVELIPHAVYVRVQFLALWEMVDVDWVIVGVYKQGTTSLARYLSFHPQLDVVWNTPIVLENTIFSDNSRLLPLQHRVNDFNNAAAPNIDKRCRAWDNSIPGWRFSHDGRFCLASNITRGNAAVSRGIKMSPLTRRNIFHTSALRFVWTDIFPNLSVKVIVSITDPVQCFYSRYYWSLFPSHNVSLRDCINQAVRERIENRKKWLLAENDMWSVENKKVTCAPTHSMCAASFVLTESCIASPSLCTAERLKVVRMRDLTPASYNRLVRWVSKGKATQEFAPELRERYNFNVNANEWSVRNGTRYPSEISYEIHQLLHTSFASEYRDIESWLTAFAP